MPGPPVIPAYGTREWMRYIRAFRPRQTGNPRLRGTVPRMTAEERHRKRLIRRGRVQTVEENGKKVHHIVEWGSNHDELVEFHVQNELEGWSDKVFVQKAAKYTGMGRIRIARIIKSPEYIAKLNGRRAEMVERARETTEDKVKRFVDLAIEKNNARLEVGASEHFLAGSMERAIEILGYRNKQQGGTVNNVAVVVDAGILERARAKAQELAAGRAAQKVIEGEAVTA